jgi:hypothetical protein
MFSSNIFSRGGTTKPSVNSPNDEDLMKLRSGKKILHVNDSCNKASGNVTSQVSAKSKSSAESSSEKSTYIAPTTDDGFKILTGTKKFTWVLLLMLNSFMATDKTMHGVKSTTRFPFMRVTQMFTDLLPLGFGEPNRVSVDCACKVGENDERGRYFIIEMQRYEQCGIFSRFLFYLSRFFVNQASIPTDYTKLEPVRLIAFFDLRKRVITAKDQYISHNHFRDSNTMEVTIDVIAFTLVDFFAAREIITKDVLKNHGEKLSKDQVKAIQEIIGKSEMEKLGEVLTIAQLEIYAMKFAYLFVNAADMTKEDVEELFGDDPIMLAVFKEMEIANLPLEQRESYEKAKSDRKAWDDELERKLKEEFDKGCRQGRNEGFKSDLCITFVMRKVVEKKTLRVLINFKRNFLKCIKRNLLKCIKRNILKCIKRNILKCIKRNILKCIKKNILKCIKRNLLKCIRKKEKKFLKTA